MAGVLGNCSLLVKSALSKSYELEKCFSSSTAQPYSHEMCIREFTVLTFYSHKLPPNAHRQEGVHTELAGRLTPTKQSEEK